MRPIRSGEQVGDGNNVVEKQSLVAAREAWNMWEIHFLMLLSLFLQVFLFLTAGLRRRKTSLILRSVLWLAYLSADAVAIFVLGHLAARASEPRHQLMSFWAPFVLVHLGGQDTITAFSKQDNELWRRHLLSLVTQVGVAAYVVAKASWPDRLLKSAMVLMFLAGCFKYVERTFCLYLSNPSFLRSDFLDNLSTTLGALRIRERSDVDTYMRFILNLFSQGKIHNREIHDVVCVDAPSNKEQSILAVDSLPSLLKEFRSSAGRYRAYESAGSHLVNTYDDLYTKRIMREAFYELSTELLPNVFKESFFPGTILFLVFSPMMLNPLLQFVSAPVALVLFTFTEKGDLTHTSRADITVSYLLLLGAIALEVSSATMFLLSKCFPSTSSSRKKQWSEELRQYNMIKRHVVQGTTTGGVPSIRQWIGKRLGKWGVGLLELTHTPLTEPVKALILDNLLLHGTRKEWHIASSHGLLAVQNWKERHQDYLASESIAKALEKTINGVADFPTSVLIWHLATDICYYYSGGAASTTNNNRCDDQVKEEDNNKEASRQISNYVMYLVFKCGVKLSTNSQHLHDKAHKEIRYVLLGPQNQRRQFTGGEKAAFMKIFDASKKEGGEEQKDDWTSDGNGTTTQHDDTAGDNHVKKLLQSAQAFDSPVLPRASKLAQKLISIDEGEADRWGLIAAVWSEMLYYAAPRCGGAFHYEHLSTGGEFATHVVVLMRELGPFMPPPDDPA